MVNFSHFQWVNFLQVEHSSLGWLLSIHAATPAQRTLSEVVREPERDNLTSVTWIGLNITPTVSTTSYLPTRPVYSMKSLREVSGVEGERESREAILVHAPTVCVNLLRQAAEVLERAAETLPSETIFFPEKEMSETQPIELLGRVPLRDLAGLVCYLADMLEV